MPFELKHRTPVEAQLYVLQRFVRGLAGIDPEPTGLEDVPVGVKLAAEEALMMSDAAFELAKNNPPPK